MYMKAGWAIVQVTSTLSETIPSHDVIEHTSSFTCPCAPEITSQFFEGRVYWHISHNSFDETLDEEQTEPYKGLW